MIYLKLFFAFFKVGLFTIGGGYAMIPLIGQELVDAYMTMDEFIDVIAISEVTPGPFAVNAATFTGMKLLSVPGAIVCTLGVISPSLILMTLVALFFFNINQKPAVQAALFGVRPAVWALILSATIGVAKNVLLTGSGFEPSVLSAFNITGICLFAAVFACMRLAKKINPIFFILGAGVFGAVFLR
ncbi:MAG: chromate transporter [Oscillospiraceae bacterium]|nr:chromate transporter [Oscillospiraceae bacterium]